jgi:prepilin-type N-terminal cleavage/methylation domain-containing protein
MKQRGFTVIELLVAVAFLIFAGILFAMQKANIEVAARDEKRKIAINAMFYSLEENFYVKNGYYPNEISQDNLTTMDSSLFTDPGGVKLGQLMTIDDSSVASDYRYEPTNCTDNKCKSYTLRADLENEADYIKKSKHQ